MEIKIIEFWVKFQLSVIVKIKAWIVSLEIKKLKYSVDLEPGMGQ